MGSDRPIRAAIYVRVSTEDQAKEGFSLDAQLDRLHAYCRSRDWVVFDEYIDDGHSGRTIKRPAYRKMMREIDEWDMLLVIKMDRIHRNSKNFMIMMEDLNNREKGFTSMMESLDTSTAMGRFVMDIIQRIAQLESEQIGERVYIGMEQKAKTIGGILGFNIPYGYDYKDSRLVVNKKEAAIVEDIFSLYLKGHGMKAIAEYLNVRGVLSKQGKHWGSQTISTILKNPLYCGYLRWEKYLNAGDHTPLISEETFNAVQQVLKEKNQQKGIDYKPTFINK